MIFFFHLRVKRVRSLIESVEALYNYSLLEPEVSQKNI